MGDEATDGKPSSGVAVGDDVTMSSFIKLDHPAVALLVNPAANAGRASRNLKTVLELLHRRGVKPELLEARSSSASIEAVANSPAERVLVMGGDGTVHLAASVLSDTDRILGIIPTGTGDDAARALELDRKSVV